MLQKAEYKFLFLSSYIPHHDFPCLLQSSFAYLKEFGYSLEY